MYVHASCTCLTKCNPDFCVLRGQTKTRTNYWPYGRYVFGLPTSGSSDVIGGNRGGYNILT